MDIEGKIDRAAIRFEGTKFDDAWLSGFLDGEGSFIIRKMKNSSVSYRFVVNLHMRADEIEIIREISDVFGGSVGKPRMQKDKPNPFVDWRLSAFDDVISMISYLNKYPLRAKKARDYSVWKNAFKMYYQAIINSGRKNPEWLTEAMDNAIEANRGLKTYQASPMADVLLQKVRKKPEQFILL